MKKIVSRSTMISFVISILCCIFTISVHAQRLKISSTTSTDNTGLFGVLNPPFEKMFQCRVDVIAQGTGKALKTGEMGDCDVVFVHSRPAEDKFIEEGFGVNRRDVMYNDFIILGPKEDPAGIKGLNDAARAMQKIATQQSSFISRGTLTFKIQDKSGKGEGECLTAHIVGSARGETKLMLDIDENLFPQEKVSALQDDLDFIFGSYEVKPR